MNSSIGVARRSVRPGWIVQLCQIFIVLVGIAARGAEPSRADTWVPVGVPGGNVRSLTADPRDPQRIYLGTADGILYRSDDAGARWRRLSPGFPLRGCSLDQIVIDPGGTVFVGYWEIHDRGGGVARSTDGGETFRLLKGIQGESVRALAMAPSDPRVIAAGTLDGVFLSRSSGQSWSRVTAPGDPNLRNVESLAFDPHDANVLVTGTWHLAWKTRDGGATWESVHQGMIDDSDVMTLTFDRRRPQTIYATACTGIYRSTESAEQWTKLRGIPYSSRRTRAFAQGVDDARLLLAGTTEGLWVSEDEGVSWHRTTPNQLVVNAVLAQPDGTILLGTEESGVLRSSDRGRSWASSNTGFSERFVNKLLFDEVGRRLICAVWGATRYGAVFVAQGVEGPWMRMGNGLDGRQVLSLALQGRTILAGTDDGVFARGPDATSWRRLRTVIDGDELHPRVTELLALPSDRLLAATTNGVIRSMDAGKTWNQPLSGSEVYDLAESQDDPQVVVAATRFGFFRSQDGGDTWTKTSPPLDATPHALAFVPSARNILFATTTGGLYRSDDQGVTWRLVNGGLPHSDLTGIAVNPDGRTVYVSDFTWGGIFRSTDCGASWSRMPTDGLGSDRVWTLSMDPAAPDRLLAAPSAGGLHMLGTSSVSSRAGAKASD